MNAAQGKSLGGARVLIVEDEYLIADDLALAVRRAGGEPVGPVPTVRQAEQLLATEPVDAAILDLNLRGSMASAFAKRLAESRLPCLIVSGYSGDGSDNSLSQIERLEKPVDPAAVMAALQAQLARVS